MELVKTLAKTNKGHLVLSYKKLAKKLGLFQEYNSNKIILGLFHLILSF